MKRNVLLLVMVLCLGFLPTRAQEPSTTYTYTFGNNVSQQDCAMPQDASIKYDTFTTTDDLVTIQKNGTTQFWYHDASHGIVIYNGNSFEIGVAGNAIITFNTCTYGADVANFTFFDADNNELGTIAAGNYGGEDNFPVSFAYKGNAGVVTAKLTSNKEVYIHELSVENAAAIGPKTGKIDVWDFGGEQLDTAIYFNHLTPDSLNAIYPASVPAGSTGKTLVNFSSGVLSWIGGSNDRLRTSNTSITRYDENLGGASGYAGRIYVNAGSATSRYISLTLSEDDEITLVTLTQSGTGEINFEYVGDPAAQTDVVPVGTSVETLEFVAKHAGTYHIFDTKDKPSYFRVYRKDATYTTLNGTVDASQAPGIPDGYSLVFTNAAGKVWKTQPSGGNYTITLPAGYTYGLSLEGANGFVISNGESLEVTESTTSYAVTLAAVELYTVTGSITGLGNALNDLTLSFTPDPAQNKVFTPTPVIDAGAATYTVQLEPNCLYTIASEGVNDFELPDNTIEVSAAATKNLAYSAKATYKVSINGDGLNAEQLAKLQLTFTNLYEEGYSYSFTSVDEIYLRNGTYAISYGGLDDYAVEMGLTSNLTVDGAPASKTIHFNRITNWPFNDRNITAGTAMYKGLVFTGGISNERAKGHLVCKDGATIKIPVNPGDKIQVTYYYTADFTIEGGAQYLTQSQSTSQLEYADFEFPGFEPGFVTLTIGNGVSTTYITNIAIGGKIPYAPVIYVGEDKEYTSINEALNGIARMTRTADQRVVVRIDPGNYEEMLVITSPNITLKNAADAPGIGLSNKGVGIEENAVRITSYYGHGYNYFSMGSNNKWDAEVLRVNIENGYLSHSNAGSGSTNNSYWNATVVVAAKGFEAEHIIFENSFNQYISAKEADDVVVEWEIGGKGTRPTDAGNTAVQNRSYVERAAAIAFTGSADKVILSNCRVVGRQDSFYGDGSVRMVIYKGAIMGAVDYIFGAMKAVFYQSDLVLNTSDTNGDAAYITAASQEGGRGYLMYECTVTSPVPGVETASANGAKPGYFGRPWKPATSEVVFFNTTIKASTYPGSEGKSLISPVGWTSSLGGESPFMYEYGTVEASGENNQNARAAWSTLLTQPKLNDGTDILPFNYTKGNDGWDPLPELIARDGALSVTERPQAPSTLIYSSGNTVFLDRLTASATIHVYSLNGTRVKSIQSSGQESFHLNSGIYIIQVSTKEALITEKIIVQ